MRSKGSPIKNELVAIKEQLEQMKHRELQTQTLVNSKEKSDQTSSHLLTLLKYMMEDSKVTRRMLEQIQKKFDEVVSTDLTEEEMQGATTTEQEPTTKIVPISELDRKIVQYLQMQHAGMACADDVKKIMNYKGRNAASARLNKLHTLGILSRYQLGHKVYYKFDAGKMTKGMLIVSPPQ